MQKSQYQIKKGKTEAGSRWNEECQRLLLSVFAVRIPITDNLPICFGHRYFVWISLMKRLLFSRPLLLLSVLALVFGGAINLLEGYGNDNPGAKSQGMKQLMAK